jgi:DNA-binding SARP family transcriptional activator
MNETAKLIVMGNSGLTSQSFATLNSNNLEVTLIPENYPVHQLDLFSPFQLVVINVANGHPEHLETIRSIHRQYKHIPLLLAQPQPEVRFILSAFRNGLTDCVQSKEELQDWIHTLAVPADKHPEHRWHLISPWLQQLSFNEKRNETNLHVSFLGTLSVHWQNKRINLPSGHRLRSLLAFLLFHHGKNIPRTRIIQQFWGDSPLDCGANNLNVAINSLRRYFAQHTEEEVIVSQNGYVTINPDLSFSSDLAQYQQLWHQGRAAVSKGSTKDAYKHLYELTQLGYDFLEEMNRDSWTFEMRTNFEEHYLFALEFCAKYHLQQKNFEEALTFLLKSVSKDGCIEATHRLILECYLGLGKRPRAQRHLEQFKATLREQLRKSPTVEFLGWCRERELV